MSSVFTEKLLVFSIPKVELDPTMVHPASLISAVEEDLFSEKARRGTLPLDAVHPASIPLADERHVKDGYGELILRVKEGASFRPVTRDEYAKAYQIFQKYAPRLEAEPRPLRSSRIEMMREELRRINPNMVGTFISRTLHDLIFIRKYIEEDIESEKGFTYEDRYKPTASDRRRNTFTVQRNFWGTGNPDAGKMMFKDSDPFTFIPVDIQEPADTEIHFSRLVDIGYRLNAAACEILNTEAPYATHLRRDQIQNLVEHEIHFLRDYYQNQPFRHAFLTDWSKPSLSCAFLEPQRDYFNFRPMAIDTDATAQIIRNAASLECQKSSIGKVLAFRGGDLDTDYPVRGKSSTPYCISFGSGLFSGVVNDPGACPFSFMRTRPDGCVFMLDPGKESTQYFLTPSYTALESLFGHGESWHYRYKVSRDEGSGFPDGVSATGKGLRSVPMSVFKSPLSRKQLLDRFDDLRDHNVAMLKSKNRSSFSYIVPKKAKEALTFVRKFLPL